MQLKARPLKAWPLKYLGNYPDGFEENGGANPQNILGGTPTPKAGSSHVPLVQLLKLCLCNW